MKHTSPANGGARRLVAKVTAAAALLVAAACTTTPTATAPGAVGGSTPGSVGTAERTGPAVSAPDTGKPDQVRSLPGLGPVESTQFAGYSSVNQSACSTVRCDGAGDTGLFYWFVGKGTDLQGTPTILWTNGGPGATSFWGFFTENGPYRVRPDATLTPYADGWNHTASYLMFDHPLGVGLSFAPEDQLPTNVQAGVDQWYTALVHFLEQHPDVAANPIVLAGESYGGTYVPLLAKAILDGNARAGRQVVDLGGIILAAPWTDPVVGQSMDTTYAFTHGLISAADKARLDQVYERCKTAIEAQRPSTKAANDTCGQLKSEIEKISGRYLLNIASTGDPATDQVVTYLNKPEVRDAIHAKPTGTFDFFAEPIGDRYTVGGQDSYRATVQELLDRDVRVMVISGLNDATDVNPLGVGAWLDLLTGPKADAFKAATPVQWKNGGKDVLGYVQSGGGLQWVTVLGAGHLAVMDQPQLIDLIDQELLEK